MVVILPGATNTSLTLANLQPEQAGSTKRWRSMRVATR
jgi:hypothetical protein